MSWLNENWFKLALVLVIPITAVVLVYGFVIYPENVRQEERASAERQARIEAALTESKKEQRAESLKTCLSESESQETYAHLSYCGNDGRSPSWCSDVYGGAKNIGEVLDNFRASPVYADMGLEDTFDSCNCSLEGWIRDGFQEDKTERDTLCYSLYSN